ncbi:hypothetical protein [Streptomyces glomeratus]|uniref:hypothetical protein n=1 Tax=Streptomyces glomeratus TaxID=284452 RepID=UPI001F1758AD|nr:hypothetical protein [Streptomyces glomeratus]MCF1506285.1 hypothetical protein [Streptomyces glomeratus]
MPLPKGVATMLRDHSKKFEPIDVTLPWRTPDGHLVTKRLISGGAQGRHLRVGNFNDHRWKPALASDGIIALRHFYAAVLLGVGAHPSDSRATQAGMQRYLGLLRIVTEMIGQVEPVPDDALHRRRLLSEHHGPHTARAA